MTKGELKDIIRECYEEILAEDKSDIASYYSQQRAMDKVRSEKGIPKRPRINGSMDEDDKDSLHNYDHGSRMDSRSNIMASRHSGSERDGYKQTARSKEGADRANIRDSKYYDDGNRFMGMAYKGTGSSHK